MDRRRAAVLVLFDEQGQVSQLELIHGFQLFTRRSPRRSSKPIQRKSSRS